LSWNASLIMKKRGKEIIDTYLPQQEGGQTGPLTDHDVIYLMGIRDHIHPVHHSGFSGVRFPGWLGNRGKAP